MKNAMIINEKDNVLAAIEDIKKGSEVIYLLNGKEEKIIADDDIPVYHKLARKDILKGEVVIKYGEYIGEAAEDILKGQYVHTHNVLSIRHKTID